MSGELGVSRSHLGGTGHGQARKASRFPVLPFQFIGPNAPEPLRHPFPPRRSAQHTELSNHSIGTNCEDIINPEGAVVCGSQPARTPGS